MSNKTFADSFSKYQPNASENVDELWRTATIVLDTNVIGQLYRVARSSREVLLSNLEALSARLWLPHQVGIEYHRRREDLRNQTQAAFNASAQELERVLPSLQKRVKQIKELDLDFDVQTHVDTIERSMRAIIDTVKKSATGETKEAVDEDVYGRLAAIFDESNVGPAFSAKQLHRHRIQAIRRYELQIPPGFRDAGKKGDQAFGDYFIWAQILKEFKKRPGGVIFVTNDMKDDWYDASTGRARTELHEEFATVTGERILLTNTPDFITHSSALLEKSEEEAREAATEFGEESDFDEWFTHTELGSSATRLAAAQAKEQLLFGPMSGVAAATNALNGVGADHYAIVSRASDALNLGHYAAAGLSAGDIAGASRFYPSDLWAKQFGIGRYGSDLVQGNSAINIMKDVPSTGWMIAQVTPPGLFTATRPNKGAARGDEADGNTKSELEGDESASATPETTEPEDLHD